MVRVSVGSLVGTVISLPPGCTVTYAIFIDIDTLTNEILEWYHLQGGVVEKDSWYDNRGKLVDRHFVRLPKSKRCHHRQDGSGGVRLHFHGDDASTASLFLIKFFDHVQQHNLKEHMERVTHDQF